MLEALFQLLIFTCKAVIVIVLILVLIAGILTLLGRGKEKLTGRISIKNLNEKYADTKANLLSVILSKNQFKKFLKEKKQEQKKKQDSEATKNIFVLTFHGDIKASAVSSLSEEITAILNIATPKDEVVVKIESGGGMVHAYGLGASELQRIKQQKIPLTVAIDKIAASGGYLMACVADKIIAAPFAIIGSIGVIFQLPNFHRVLQHNHIDFEQITAGNYKRTLTLFGKNTEEGREKLREELEDIHHYFKQVIQANRPQIDIEKVSTGEHWLAKQAEQYKLVDGLQTSDDYLLEQSKVAKLYEIKFQTKKTFVEKITTAAQALKQAFLGMYF